jgi:hypothetical protein
LIFGLLAYVYTVLSLAKFLSLETTLLTFMRKFEKKSKSTRSKNDPKLKKYIHSHISGIL